MIVDALLNFALGVLQFFWNLMPEWTVTVPQPALDLVSEISQWDALLPFTELMQITAILGTFFAAVLGFKVIKWIIDSILAVIP